MRFAGECFLAIAAGALVSAGTFALFKLLNIIEDCRAERERRDR